MDNTFLSRLEWRFATKKFDPVRKVSEEDLRKILKAIRFAPTSMGLQPFHVFVVTDEKLREELLPVSNNQPQVTNASHLLIFCLRTGLREIGERYAILEKELDSSVDEDALKARLTGFAEQKEKSGVEFWSARQTYIALGFGLAACAELGIDSCPMEGFDAAGVDGVLGLPPHIKSAAYLAIGYRKEGPTRPKFRFPEGDLFSKR